MNKLRPVKLKLILPGNMSFLEIALTFIVNSANVFGFSKSESSQIRLASEEALANIILNALNDNPDEEYTVICRRLPTRMEVVLQDKGMPFSPNEIPDYNPGAPDKVDGLSMYLLKHSVDEVQFRNLGRNGKETVLIKNIGSTRIDRILEKQKGKSKAEETVPITEWHLRPFDPVDALEISRCAYQTYGYSYEPYIYYPERITEMNQNGELKSMVAVDENDNLLAHFALKFYHPEDPIAEAGVAFVKPAYRRLAIFSEMCRDAFARAKEQGLQGVYGRAVTSHPLSQKKLVDFNFISCGVLLGLFPSDVNFKGLTGKTVQKESSLLMYLPIKSPVRTIYPPARHQEIINGIFARGAIGVSTGASGEVNPENNPERFETPDTLKLSYSRMEVFNTADIICYSGEEKIVDEIHAAKKRLCIEHTDVLYLFLDLENPGCAIIAEACEALGFFFSGVLPYGMHGRHALILQYLNNLEIDYEKIKLYEPYAQKLLNYVSACEQS